MTKTSEFLTLLRNYRGLVGTIRQGGVFISFDSIRFNYYADADEIQFLLFRQIQRFLAAHDPKLGPIRIDDTQLLATNFFVDKSFLANCSVPPEKTNSGHKVSAAQNKPVQGNRSILTQTLAAPKVRSG